MDQPSAPLSTEQFLFNRKVFDILDHCKKNIKTPPFDDMNIEQLLANNKTQRIDIYHQHFLIGIGNNKTRETVTKNYDYLIRENCINKNFLPPNMISGIVNARSAVGVGSTASSGSGSVVGASLSQIQIDRSVHIGKLVCTIICCTLQPSAEITTGLNFILEGTRNKTYGSFFFSLMDEVYLSLSKYREKPVDRFLLHFLNSIANQVQYHEAPYRQYLKKQQSMSPLPGIIEPQPNFVISPPPEIFPFINRREHHQKSKMCIHAQNYDAKFGKCFMCERDANNYDKVYYVPLCGMECKSKLKRINDECQLNDHFCFLHWLIESIQNGSDQIVYSLLLREISKVKLNESQIGAILEALIGNISLSAIGTAGNKIIESSALIFSHLVRKYTQYMFRVMSQQQYHRKQPNQFHSSLRPCYEVTKIFLFEIVKLLENLPITNATLQLTLLKCLTDILTISDDQGNLALRKFYFKCDCALFEPNLVERIFNITGQYALHSSTGLANNDGMNAMSMGVIHTIGMTGDDCSDSAIAGVEQILVMLSQNMNRFDSEGSEELKHLEEWQGLYKQKQVKKYLQSKIIDQFNKKPTKAIKKMRELFNQQITPKEVSIFIRQNLDYESKVKKSHLTITKMTAGEYFGHKDEYNQIVYKQFLSMLETQIEGLDVDDCLRIAFNTFSLPKQAQQIQVIFEELSLLLEPHLGLKVGEQGTATYQFIMAAIMVQTSTNPNVKQKQKIKLEDFKGICSRITGGVSESRVVELFHRITNKPLEIVYQFKGIDKFTKKYLSSDATSTSCWKEVNLDELTELNFSQEQIQSSEGSPSKKGTLQRLESKTSLLESSTMSIKEKKIMGPLAFTMFNLWQFIYMSLINKNNIKGVEQSCILYGRCELKTEFQVFFMHLFKIYTDLMEKTSVTLQHQSLSAKLVILKLAIEYGNYILGVESWLAVVKIIYKLDEQENPRTAAKLENSYSYYEYETSDKLLTRTQNLRPIRLKQFLEAMCEFSSSEVKRDTKYTREMYILHRIVEIIGYNLTRLEEKHEEASLWSVVWPTIRNYFRSICVHPRQDIAMSAIDSYKQLTMKIFKLNAANSDISHTEIMSVYLYTFERSPSYLKDLIINVLLNVVSRDMHGGWNQLYTILQISDSEDKGVVMRVVNRLILDVGLEHIGNLLRLHRILIKQLRIAEDQVSVDNKPSRNSSSCNEIIDRLYEVSLFFNRLDIWLETLKYVKDIYKLTTNSQILPLLYKICNVCVQILHKQKEGEDESSGEREQAKNEGVEEIEQMISEEYIENILEDSKNMEIERKLTSQQAHAVIFHEILEAQLHILEIKSAKQFSQALDCFKELTLEIVFRDLGNHQNYETGFISIWEMFLNSQNNVEFSFFLKDYFKIIFRSITSFVKAQELADTITLLLSWVSKLYKDTMTNEILTLCEEDQDLNLAYPHTLLKEITLSSKVELIQFSLSSKQYECKAIQHLTQLKIFSLFFDSELAVSDYFPHEMKQKILLILSLSYETASKVNDKPLLRNFLWNNDFLKSEHGYLPGLLKQEQRQFEVLIKNYSFSEQNSVIYDIAYKMLRKYEERMRLFVNRVENKENDESNTAKLRDILYQDLGMWLTNSEHNIILTLEKLTLAIKQREPTVTQCSRELFDICLELSKGRVSRRLLTQCSALLQNLTHFMF